MLLAVDIGNTEITFGLFDGDALREAWSLRTDITRSSDEYGALLTMALQTRGFASKDVSEIWVGSVVPALTRLFRAVCPRYFGQEPRFITSASDLGVRLDVDYPNEVGADRVINAVAAQELYELPAIVVDFGTTTNLDVIGVGGVFQGGAFMPGIQISMDALFQRATMLRPVELQKPKRVIGRNTAECLQSGLYYGFLGQMERMLEQMTEELRARPTVIATGGLSELIARDSDSVSAVEPNLTLKGIRFAQRRLTGAE